MKFFSASSPLSKLEEKVPCNPAITYDGCSVFEPADAKHRVRQVGLIRFFPEEQKRSVSQLIPGHEPEPREYCCNRFALIGNGEAPGTFCLTHKESDRFFVNIRKAVL